jgi:molecular chaperone GrpE
LQAEFDNYRKRTLKEKMSLVESGGENVIKALLPVVDDVDRALAAMEKSDDVEALRGGVRLIAQKFNEVMRQQGVSEIEAVGKEFDVDHHEAVARFPIEGKSSGEIIDVVQKGYKLGEKVIRYAKVVVAE